MTETETGPHWEDLFQECRTRWERGALNPVFLAWLSAGALPAGRILVPGAGRSPEPLALARAGRRVTTVDLAPSAAAFQRARLAGLDAEVIEADLLAWEPAAPYDAIYDQTCLCALPPAAWPRYTAGLHRWLRPGGVLAVLFMQTGREGGPPWHCDLDRMRALFPAVEWQWPETLAPLLPHPVGIAEQPALLTRRG
jgi:SAM-dependent methyltransferase